MTQPPQPGHFGAFSQQDEERKLGTPELTAPGIDPKITSIFDFSTEALNQLRFYFEQNPPAIPISQLVGFSQLAAQTAAVDTGEGTASDTYVDLATVGPQLTLLPDGAYAFIFGCQAYNLNATGGAHMALSVNGGTATTAAVSYLHNQYGVGVSKAITAILSNGGNNTVTAKYSRGNAAGTAQFSDRWLLAIRTANP